MKRKDRVHYVQNWPFTSYVGYVPSEAAWAYEMKRMGIQDHPWPTRNGAGGHCTCLTNKEDGKRINLITVDTSLIERDGQVVEILTHEAVHAWQNTLEHIKESSPSPEFEAYMIADLVRGLFETYKEVHGG